VALFLEEAQKMQASAQRDESSSEADHEDEESRSDTVLERDTDALSLEGHNASRAKAAIDKERQEIDRICMLQAREQGSAGFAYGAIRKTQSTPKATTGMRQDERDIRDQVRLIDDLERRYQNPRDHRDPRDCGDPRDHRGPGDRRDPHGPHRPAAPERGRRDDDYAPRRRREERNLADVFLEGIKKLVDSQRSSDTVTKKLELPVFSGKAEDYMNWRIHFMAGLNERHLTPQQKAMYLKGRVSGKPLEMLNKCASIRINDQSFNEWLEMLDENYGGLHKVQEQLAQELRALPILTDVKKSSLQRFRLTLMLHYNHYKETEPWALKTPNTMLLKAFKSKVDARIGARYQDFLDQKGVDDDFISFRQWLQTEYVKADLQEEMWHSSTHGHDKKGYKKDDRRKPRFYVCDDSQATSNQPDSETEQAESAAEGGTEGDEAAKAGSSGESSLSEDQFYALKRSYEKAKQRFEPWKADRKKKSSRSSYQKEGYKPKKFQKGTRTNADFVDFKCPRCKSDEHWLARCQKFSEDPPMMRVALARRGRICFHCLEGRHLMTVCKKDTKKKCGVKGCTDRHHPMLHRPPFQVKIEDMLSDDSDLPSESEIVNHCEQVFNTRIYCNLGKKRKEVSLQTVVCEILTNKEPERVIALLDSGATTSCIDASLAKRLKLKVLSGPQSRTMALLNQTVTQQSHYVDIVLQDVNRENQANIQAWTVEGLTQNSRAVDWSEKKREFEHLKGVDFPESPMPAKIGILIGNDFLALLHGEEVRRDEGNLYAPVAIRTPLGWTCSGHTTDKKGPRYLVKLKSDKDMVYYTSHLCQVSDEESDLDTEECSDEDKPEQSE
jgi:hypothetical protein